MIKFHEHALDRLSYWCRWAGIGREICIFAVGLRRGLLRALDVAAVASIAIEVVDPGNQGALRLRRQLLPSSGRRWSATPADSRLSVHILPKSDLRHIGLSICKLTRGSRLTAVIHCLTKHEEIEVCRVDISPLRCGECHSDTTFEVREFLGARHVCEHDLVGTILCDDSDRVKGVRHC
jgi:hypothetical protein